VRSSKRGGGHNASQTLGAHTPPISPLKGAGAHTISMHWTSHCDTSETEPAVHFILHHRNSCSIDEGSHYYYFKVTGWTRRLEIKPRPHVPQADVHILAFDRFEYQLRQNRRV